MAPLPKGSLIRDVNSVESTHEGPDLLNGDEVVITGVSGLYPKSDNFRKFMQNLYNKVDMTSAVDDVDNVKHRQMPRRFGKIEGTSRFDSHFFRVTHWQASSLNPMYRKILEESFKAIFDSGINPLSMSGTKLGVFVGSYFSDSGLMSLYDIFRKNGFIISGASATMAPNRVSYWIDGKGPSFSIDQGCTSSMACLEIAFQNIRSGVCEAALVIGDNLCVHPILNINLRHAGLLCLDGKTKCFDKNADGYVRSDAISVIFLQKAKDARRIYAEVCHIKGKYFTQPDANFLPIRKTEDLKKFFKEFYSEIDVSPDEVEFIETSGVGIAKAERNELEAIGQFFGHREPIKVGSVSSNAGYTDAASGVTAITKMCGSYQNGYLPGNLHYQEPHDIPEVLEGKVQVVTSTTTFKRGYTAVNNFSHTGVSYHVLLRGHYKQKRQVQNIQSIPHLILVSGRHEEAVNKIIDEFKSNSIDSERIALLRNIFKTNIVGHTARGYAILDATEHDKTICHKQAFDFFSGEKRPIWFLYSGMGSQWPGMGAELMRIPTFSATIRRCQKFLRQKGVDIINIITSDDKNSFDHIINSFIGITAVQLGLTDVLKEIGIVPDNLIGHSFGEFGCAYADGSLTLEEVILSSYARGEVFMQNQFIHGAMAAVGLGHKDVKPLCPPEIDIACHNSSESCTISGPYEVINKFVEELSSQGIFVKAVQCANNAYHSRYITEAGPFLVSSMKEIIKDPKLRGDKWICTAAPEDQWESAKYASAEYFTANLLSPVYFEEGAKHIPDNAIVIEIAPHGLLQAIVKRSHTKCTHIPLTQRAHSDPIKFLLDAFGKLYLNGLNLKLDPLYPKIEFPVSTETPAMSDLVEWDHTKEWYENSYKMDAKVKMAARNITLGLHDEDYKYVRGYLRNGVNVIPESTLLVLTWQTLAMYKGIDYRTLSVTFENVTFYGDIVIPKEGSMGLRISIQKGSNRFEITNDENYVVTGFIEIGHKINSTGSVIEYLADDFYLDSNDVYTLLKFKGFSYGYDFHTIQSANMATNKALIKWTGEWIMFLDSLIQLNILARNHEGVSTPRFINKLSIDTTKHENLKCIGTGDAAAYIAQICEGLFGTTKCGGVLINCLTFKDTIKIRPKYTLEQRPFVLSFPMKELEGQQRSYCKLPFNGPGEISNVKLNITTSGIFDSLFWEEVVEPSNENTLVQVYYAGISMKDCYKIVGSILDGNTVLGMDFSGYNHKGERVMGVIQGGALASVVESDPNLLWPVPEHWSLEDAATVPLPYLHAYYCLAIKDKLYKGQTVLVTGGAGALGQAVISICLASDCTVITVVSSPEKKKFLLDMFPKLKESHIGYSRHPDSLLTVVANTKKKSCDIIISCSDSRMKEAFIKCTSFEGLYQDVNIYNVYNNGTYGMSSLARQKSYMYSDLSEIFKPEYVNDKKMLQMMISEGIAKGIVRPISRVLYSPDKVSKAFRLLSSSKHIGRVLIEMNCLSETVTLDARHRNFFSPNNVFVVICDNNAYGIEFAEYLINRGARKLVLHIKSNRFEGYLQFKIQQWKIKDADVIVRSENIRDMTACESILQFASNVGTIAGIFVVEDAINTEGSGDVCVKSGLSQQEPHVTFEYIDLLSRKMCLQLRYFAFISFVPESQINEFSLLDKISKERNELRLPVLILRNELGNKADEMEDSRILESTLSALDKSLKYNYTNVTIRNENGRNDVDIQTKLAKILGTKNMEEINEELTLNDLGLIDINYEEIKAVVREFCNISLPVHGLPYMSIATLKNLEAKQKKSIPVRKNDLEALMPHIETDIIMQMEPMVVMKSKYGTQQKEEEVDPKEPSLFIIPGFAGLPQTMQPIIEDLNVQAVIMHLDPDYNEESIQTIALDMFKNIKQRFEINSPFYLLGYSFGVDIALELAALLEKEGLTGVIYCLDSSPEQIKSQIYSYIEQLDIDELQVFILSYLYKQTSGKAANGLRDELQALNDWSERVDMLIKKLSGLSAHSLQYMRLLAEAAYGRIKLAAEYEPNLKLRSKLVLIKGTTQETMKLEEDYGLSAYSLKEIQVYHIKNDHANAPYDCSVPYIINKELRPELLNNKKMQNLCDEYFKNHKV